MKSQEIISTDLLLLCGRQMLEKQGYTTADRVGAKGVE